MTFSTPYISYTSPVYKDTLNSKPLRLQLLTFPGPVIVRALRVRRKSERCRFRQATSHYGHRRFGNGTEKYTTSHSMRTFKVNRNSNRLRTTERRNFTLTRCWRIEGAQLFLLRWYLLTWSTHPCFIFSTFSATCSQAYAEIPFCRSEVFKVSFQSLDHHKCWVLELISSYETLSSRHLSHCTA